MIVPKIETDLLEEIIPFPEDPVIITQMIRKGDPSIGLIRAQWSKSQDSLLAQSIRMVIDVSGVINMEILPENVCKTRERLRSL